MHLTRKKLLLQAMLWAIGVGAKRTLPAAAALNWVIKDGLGRLGKLIYAASRGQTFDSNLKVSHPYSHNMRENAHQSSSSVAIFLEAELEELRAKVPTTVTLSRVARLIIGVTHFFETQMNTR